MSSSEKPEEARAALRAIEAAARDAQQELHRLLAVIGARATTPARLPQRGLDRLEELAAPLRCCGLAGRGAPRGRRRASFRPAVDLSAYRIVQEALTNTAPACPREPRRRHRPLFHRRLGAERGRRRPRGGASAWDGGGYGIVGMRERAAMLGGTLEAGPLPGGGYRVHARLPLEPEPES